MSSFVQLVDALRIECGVSGGTIAALANQTLEVQRLARWINLAWMDIQELHEDWFFLRQPFSFNTQANKFSYVPTPDCGIPAAPGLGAWKRDSMRIYSAALGVSNEMLLPFEPYDSWRNLWQYASMRTAATRPTMFSIDPSMNIVLGAMPDDIYTVNGEFYQAPSKMVLDADVPALPVRWHDAIVFKAMTHYGMFEAASEVLERGTTEYGKMLLRMGNQQLPVMSFGASLA